MSLAAKLRRIALNQQGLLRAESFGRGKAAVLRAIEQIGYLQIDTISVVERAHHHVLGSRVANYRPAMLEQLVGERKRPQGPDGRLRFYGRALSQRQVIASARTSAERQRRSELPPNNITVCFGPEMMGTQLGLARLRRG